MNNLTGEITLEKSYGNVPLTDGKEMLGVVSPDTEDAALYQVTSDYNYREIGTNGKETARTQTLCEILDEHSDEYDITTKNGYKYYRCDRCGELLWTEKIGPATNPFKDVSSKAYYYEPVLWAVSEGVTSGTSATTFSPDMTCTRGQCVTFLYRAAGEPSVSGIKNPFKDIKSTDYFYKAVLWAYDNDITTGTSATTFSPGMECSRGQVVTFLWRSVGEPDAGGRNPFSDVDLNQYYGDAVLWAVSDGITTGTSKTTFSPNMACSRAQIVTFLYRFFN